MGIARHILSWTCLPRHDRAGRTDMSVARRVPAGLRVPSSLAPNDIARLAAAVRLACCLAAAHIVLRFNGPSESPAWFPAIFALCAFVLSAAVLYVRAARGMVSVESPTAYWADTLCYLALTAATGGTDSHFWLFLPFPVFFAARRAGFACGMKMAAFSALALFVVDAAKTGVDSSGMGVDRLLPPAILLLSGYVIALWANSGSILNCQLAALREIDGLFNPRLNVEQLIEKVVRQLSTVYRIRSYALVLADTGAPVRLFRAELPQGSVRVSESMAIECSRRLLAIDVDGVLINDVSRGSLDRSVAGSAEAISGAQDDAAAVTAQLGSAGFCAIQFALCQGGTARLFLCSERGFIPADLKFFEQLRQQLSPRIENLRLLDRLARDVVEEERRRISRDIHDSAIQPYIGLKFALEALERRVSPGDPLASDIGRLVEMANLEIAELRRYVKGLRGQGKPEYASVVPVVRRQAARFGELYGIKINVEAEGDFAVNEILAAEVFHIVGEALSNIRRHTNAAMAHIKLVCDMEKLTVQIANPASGCPEVRRFTPRSIAERVRTLGGTCSVEVTPGHGTVVCIAIPLLQ
jgi:signal transduction histidine kinase